MIHLVVMARRRQIGREQASQDVAQLSDEEGGRDESQTPRKEDDEHQEDAAPQRPPKRSRKRKSGDVNDNDDDGDEEERPYASLRPHVQYVSSRVIQNKWTALPEGVQEKVKELLRAIERPAISSATKWEIDRNADGAAVERKRMLAQQTISEMRRMLVKRLPELTFPPNTRELDFDHEAALLENVCSHQALGWKLLLSSCMSADLVSRGILNHNLLPRQARLICYEQKSTVKRHCLQRRLVVSMP